MRGLIRGAHVRLRQTWTERDQIKTLVPNGKSREVLAN